MPWRVFIGFAIARFASIIKSGLVLVFSLGAFISVCQSGVSDGSTAGGKENKEKKEADEEDFVLFVWFLNVLVNY